MNGMINGNMNGNVLQPQQNQSQNVPLSSSSRVLLFTSPPADGTSNGVLPHQPHNSVIVHTQQTMPMEMEQNAEKRRKKRGRKRRAEHKRDGEEGQRSEEDEQCDEYGSGTRADTSPGAIGVRRFINPFEPRAKIPLPHELEMSPFSTHGTTVWKRNERERQRVQLLNNAFTQLREHLPLIDRDRRMSKVDSLKLAIAYMRHLELLLIQSHAHWTECNCFKQSYGGGDGRSSGTESTPPPN